MTAIITENLTKIFNQRKVVDRISLEVKKGEIYGFLGRNGAGKTTFINMLTGILSPSEGSFRLLEDRLENAKKRMGVLPDYSTFYDSMNGVDHLRYFAKISGKKISREEALRVLELVGLEREAKLKAGKYSFGMKKKLGIAQAIINDPELIFLDEPTSGLDAESAIQIRQLIQGLNKKGKTIFMTSHNLDEVEKICSHIAIMKNGKIYTQGTMDDLRQQFQSMLTVKFKISSVNPGQKQEIERFLPTVCIEMGWENNQLIVKIPSEKVVPVIILFLVQQKIDIYQINAIEPSLEEIFLGSSFAL